MPRGPGKKENYNLDYSRFNQFDQDEAQVQEEALKTEKAPNEADAAAGMPDMRDMLRSMPPELREAFHLMQIAKENGDTVAQERASELALKAVEKGGPEVQNAFMKEVANQMPEISGKLTKDMAGISAGTADAKSVLKGVQNEAARCAMSKQEAADQAQSIKSLKAQMEEGQKATRREMDNLAKKQEELENIRSPEDFMKFMQEEGINQEDLQRIFSGDQKFMEEKLNESVEKEMSKGGETSSKDTAEALKQVDEIHNTLFGDDNPVEEEPAPATPEPKPELPKEPEVIIPVYRLQYQKDEQGKYTVVELKCSLPGVADMSMINLDVSEKHLRLTSTAPAPRYAVNAGPFPVLIDPSGARAKYSKKREELSISVPAKAE